MSDPTPSHPTIPPQQNNPSPFPFQTPVQPGSVQIPGVPTVAVGFQAQFHSNQFPAPETAERYEKLLPGAFDRILTMAEKKQDAEISRKDRALSAAISDTKRAHVMGFIVAVGALAGGFYLVDAGHSTAGVTVILFYGVAAGISFFLRRPVGVFGAKSSGESKDLSA